MKNNGSNNLLIEQLSFEDELSQNINQAETEICVNNKNSLITKAKDYISQKLYIKYKNIVLLKRTSLQLSHEKQFKIILFRAAILKTISFPGL